MILEALRTSGLLPSSPDELRIDLADKTNLELAVGRLCLSVGETDRARSWLEHAVALRETVDVPDGLWLAEADAALAEAMLASGSENGGATILRAL